jgi:hypothetical protein
MTVILFISETALTQADTLTGKQSGPNNPVSIYTHPSKAEYYCESMQQHYVCTHKLKCTMLHVV